MTKVAGKTGSVYTTTTGTAGSVAIVAGVKSWTLDYVQDALDSTDFGDSGVRAFIAGLSGWGGSFEGYKDGAPIAIGLRTVMEFRESTNTTQKWTGSGFITGIHPSVSLDGVAAISYDFQGTGTLTVPTA